MIVAKRKSVTRQTGRDQTRLRSLGLTTTLGSHVAGLATSLLKASSAFFLKSTSLAVSSALTLHAAAATTGIATSSSEIGVITSVGVRSWSAFFNHN